MWTMKGSNFWKDRFNITRAKSSKSLIFDPLLTVSQDLLVRFLFTLGNLTASVEASRLQLFECTGSADVLLQLYDRYQRRGGAEGEEEDEEVLVKLVRVLANMCIHPAVGPALAASQACVELLLETLGERRSARSIGAVTGCGDLECLPFFFFLQFACSKFLTTSCAFRTICPFTPSPAFLCALTSREHILFCFACLRRMFCRIAPPTREILPCGSGVSGRVEPRCLQKLSMSRCCSLPRTSHASTN